VDSRSVTTLLVTHDVNDAARLGDRVFLLSARPARIVTELPIRTPRLARGSAEIEAIKANIILQTDGDRLKKAEL
jgi:ABC-type nitrate/sulfonate/bicarbonate transport system ATPase subunit